MATVGKKTTGEKIFDTFNIVIMLFMMLITLYPLWHVLAASFSMPSQLVQHQGILLKPLGFTLKGYDLVFKNPNIISGYQNTIFYVVVGTLCNLFMTSLGAYALSRKGVALNKFVTILIVITMFFGGGLVPRFLVIKDLGLLDKRMAMILPGLISAWNLIIMRTSFAAIPDSLEESAKMDGANDFTVLFRIILPLSKPIIAVMTLYYGVAHWNQWVDAMIFLRDRSLYPLQLILREILIVNSTDTMLQEASAMETEMYAELIKYSTIIVATAPILCVYPFLQKYFMKGVMVGAVKQ